MVCLDTGHHAPGTNIEFIVAQLLRLGKLGSFDFNSRFYADDDLIVGAADPFQLFRIMVEVDPRRRLRRPSSDVALMLDQCHNIEDKIPGQIRSVLNVQEMTARALLLDTEALDEARTPATCCWPTRSSWTPSTPTYDVTWPAGARSAACRPTRCAPTSSRGYQQQIEADRVGGSQAGWN